jgi:thiol-disulfide isomerase/thioredoxin
MTTRRACLALAGATALGLSQAAPYELQPWPSQQPVPEVWGSDLQGQAWRLSQLQGRAVLLNFWASWCEPCRMEMPTLQQLADIYGPDKLVVLTVNFKESPRQMARYVQSTGLGLPVLPDPQGEIASRFGVRVFPTTVLIDTRAQVRQRVRGEMDWTGQEAARLVEALWR